MTGDDFRTAAAGMKAYATHLSKFGAALEKDHSDSEYVGEEVSEAAARLGKAADLVRDYADYLGQVWAGKDMPLTEAEGE